MLAAEARPKALSVNEVLPGYQTCSSHSACAEIVIFLHKAGEELHVQSSLVTELLVQI